jgi:hypothetical protein
MAIRQGGNASSIGASASGKQAVPFASQSTLVRSQFANPAAHVGGTQPLADEHSTTAFAAPQSSRPHAPQCSGLVSSVSQPGSSVQSPY